MSNNDYQHQQQSGEDLSEEQTQSYPPRRRLWIFDERSLMLAFVCGAGYFMPVSGTAMGMYRRQALDGCLHSLPFIGASLWLGTTDPVPSQRRMVELGSCGVMGAVFGANVVRSRGAWRFRQVVLLNVCMLAVLEVIATTQPTQETQLARPNGP